MKKSIAMKWARALESGRYKQNQGALRTKNFEGKPSYCCLGVLCNITKTTKWEHKNGCNGQLYGEAGVLPQEIMKKTGISTANPIVRTDEGDTSLVNLNDKLNYSFKQIAKIIRKEWRSL